MTPGVPRLSVSPVLAAAVTLLAWLVVSSLAMLLLGAPSDGSAAPVTVALAGQAIGSVAALGVAVGFRAAGVPLEFARLVPTAALRAVMAYVAFLPVWVPIAFFVVPWIWQRIGLSVEPQSHLAWFTQSHSLPMIALAFVAVAVLGPAIEEVIFRGFLQVGLRRRLGAWPAIALTAFVFGLMHVPNGSYLLIPITLLGGLFGYLREFGGGLTAAILVHATHNALTVLLVLSKPRWLSGVFDG